MTTSLKRMMLEPQTRLAFASGFTRFLQSTGDVDDYNPSEEQDRLSAVCETDRFDFSRLPNSDWINKSREMQEQLSAALATTLLVHSEPTKKAPTLRMAVEALRCA